MRTIIDTSYVEFQLREAIAIAGDAIGRLASVKPEVQAAGAIKALIDAGFIITKEQ